MAQKLTLNSLSKASDKSAKPKSSGGKLGGTKSKQDLISSASKFAGENNKKQDTFLGSARASTNSYKFGQFNKDTEVKTAKPEIKDPTSLMSKPVRFSDRNKAVYGGGNKNSIVKILVFIAVVVAVGMGLIYFVLNFGQGEGNTNNNSTSSAEAIQPLLRPGVEVYNTILESNADITTGDADLYSNDDLSLGNEKVEDVTIQKLTYQAYEDFTRLSLGMSGVESSAPQIEISTEDTQVFISISNVDVAEDEMLELIVPKVGAFVSVEGERTGSSIIYTLSAVEELNYFAKLNDSSDLLTIDFKTDAQLNSVFSSSSSSTTTTESSSSAESSSTSSSSQTTTSKSSSAASTISGNQKLTNAKSQGIQEIINPDVNPDGVIAERYYYEDLGPKFELSFEFKGSSVSSIPNVTARIITVNGVSYIEAIMSNVKSDYFHSNGLTKSDFPGVNTTYSNLKRIFFRGKNGDSYTYWLQLGAKDDYRLTATGVSEAGRRQVKFEVFD